MCTPSHKAHVLQHLPERSSCYSRWRKTAVIEVSRNESYLIIIRPLFKYVHYILWSLKELHISTVFLSLNSFNRLLLTRSLKYFMFPVTLYYRPKRYTACSVQKSCITWEREVLTLCIPLWLHENCACTPVQQSFQHILISFLKLILHSPIFPKYTK